MKFFISIMMAAALAVGLRTSAVFAAETAKASSEFDVQKTVRNILASGGTLNATDFGIVPEVRVVDSYKIVRTAKVGEITTVKVDLKIGSVKTYDEGLHRYKEKKLSKIESEQIVIELKVSGAETSLVRPIGSYSLR